MSPIDLPNMNDRMSPIDTSEMCIACEMAYGRVQPDCESCPANQ